MSFLLEEIVNEQKDVARVYAICNIICELAVNVVVMARRYALPMTELHFNKLSFSDIRVIDSNVVWRHGGLVGVAHLVDG